MEEIIEQVEIKSTKYTLLSADKYAALNDTISEAMGFNVGLPTERYAPTEPQLAKINIAYDEEGNESYDTLPVMPILPVIQELCPQLIQDIELHDSYEPVVEQL
jgi:hypothetical protein